MAERDRCYYNEFDPKIAAWLRELIAQGCVPPGVVDERDIREVSPDDVRGYTQVHFFAGIGGWAYALMLAGWDTSRPVWTGSCPCQLQLMAGAVEMILKKAEQAGKAANDPDKY